MHELRGRRWQARCAATLSIAAVTLTLLIGASASADAQITCTHYASPDGGGDGLSQSFPFQIADFWSLAGPGKTLCLSDGTYNGANSMINPPPGLNGNNSAPITIQALNDGGVFIDGQLTRVPMHLNNNSFWSFEGFDVGNADANVGNVVTLLNSSNSNSFRRICASDISNLSPGVNSHVWL